MTNNTAQEELETRIRDRAYRIWVEEGQPDGRYLEHWLRAKREVEEEGKIVNGTEELKQYVIIGTFAPDGPEGCSGPPVLRHDATSIGDVLGGPFELELTRQHEHATPWGTIQHFQFSLFRHVG